MRTYQRPMAGWWRRNPFYLWYMLREASSVFITLYALVLLAGLYRLAQGRDAYDAWREALSHPAALAFHALTLVLIVYHAWTWFKVMPKTMPFVRLGGKRIPDRGIVAGGVAAACIGALLIFWAAWP